MSIDTCNAGLPETQIFNARFDALDTAGTVERVFACIAGRQRGWICTVNVAILMAMRSDRWLQSFVDRAALVVADGQPIVWCSPLFGERLPERVTGIDLLEQICDRAAAEGTGVYLLGGLPEVAARCAERLKASHPGLSISAADGYFAPQRAGDRVEAIRASGARILFVGMGVPRQERFIDAHWARLGVDVAIGVGGSFDVIAGIRVRAHRVLQRAGLEWVVRLLQEPRRLFPRYLVTNTQFCLLVARRLLARLLRRNAKRSWRNSVFALGLLVLFP